METSQEYLDPKTLARLEGLQLRARRIVEGYVAGLHRSPYHGLSIEFAEHREYAPGDDLRYLDWKVFGRTDRYYLKQFEEEQDCLKEARKLRFDFFLRQKPFNRLLWPVVKYIDFSLRSPGHLIFVVAIWVFIFTGIYYICLTDASSLSKLWKALSAATAFFFTLEPSIIWKASDFTVSQNLWNLVLASQGLVSFTSLSLLVSNLYMLISRK